MLNLLKWYRFLASVSMLLSNWLSWWDWQCQFLRKIMSPFCFQLPLITQAHRLAHGSYESDISHNISGRRENSEVADWFWPNENSLKTLFIFIIYMLKSLCCIAHRTWSQTTFFIMNHIWCMQFLYFLDLRWEWMEKHDLLFFFFFF